MNFPLLWMVCSRPESHLKNVFSRTVDETRCMREEIVPDDDEAKVDILTLLRDGFEEIRQKYSDIIYVNPGESWPSESQLHAIARASSGLFAFASTLSGTQRAIILKPNSIYALHSLNDLTFLIHPSTRYVASTSSINKFTLPFLRTRSKPPCK